MQDKVKHVNSNINLRTEVSIDKENQFVQKQLR